MSHNFVNNLLTRIALTTERFKGGKTMSLLPSTPEDILIVKAKSVFGYAVEIKVKRLVYSCVYNNPLFSKKQFMTFEVSSVMSVEAPQTIKQAFNQNHIFPKMLPTFVPVKHHMDRAVNAYLDMIIHSSIKDA